MKSFSLKRLLAAVTLITIGIGMLVSLFSDRSHGEASLWFGAGAAIGAGIGTPFGPKYWGSSIGAAVGLVIQLILLVALFFMANIKC